MKTLALLVLLTLPLPALAQDAPATPPAEDEGFSLMEEGAKLLFRGLMQEMEPALDGMGEAMKELQPAVAELLALIDDIRNYEAPRMLENGDILIPRRKDAPLQDPAPNGEIEL